MSKIFMLLLLAALVIPAGVFAAPPGSSCSACGAANATWSAPGYGMMGSGSDGWSSANGTARGYVANASRGMMNGYGRIPPGTNPGSYGMMRTGRAGNNGNFGGMMGGYGPGSYGMMGGYYGQGGAGMGMNAWAAVMFLLCSALVIVWIIVGILLIFLLYRKLSAK